MKKLFILFAMLTCMAVANAQSSLVATLNHNDTVKVYYGVDALRNAYNASVDGDVITLSSGGFNAPETISKEITIRGAGMEQDTANNIAPTVIEGEIIVCTPQSEESIEHKNRFVMEGVYVTGYLRCGDIQEGPICHPLKNAQFIKCHFSGVSTKSLVMAGNAVYTTGVVDVSFIQCRIEDSIYLSSRIMSNAVFINCVLQGPAVSSANIGESNLAPLYCELINCVINGLKDDGNVSYNMKNCILLTSGHYMSSRSIARNCVALNYGSSGVNTFKNLPFEETNIQLNGSSESSVCDAFFKTYRGGIHEKTETFELTDEAKKKYLGDDGTEVGIYGGNFPYSPKTLLPKIKKFDVASKTTADGKLKVEIEVSAADE